MRTWQWRVAVAAGAAGAVLMGGQAVAAPGGNTWSSAGGDRNNTRSASSESKISPATVGGLRKAWEFTTGGDVSATPAVDSQNVYFPDAAGNLFAVNRMTGQEVWRSSIATFSGKPGDKARATPALTGSSLVLGNQGPFGGGGDIMSVDKATGRLQWITSLDDHPAAAITQSATVFDGVVYVGVSSLEESFALIPGYDCCTFRGSMAALDAATGRVLWKTRTTPEGFPGNAVWGSSPVVDPKRRTVYIATGNNYDLPAETLTCVTEAGDDQQAQLACLPADDYFDSVLALDMRTGAVKWVTKAIGFDAWTVDCIPALGEGTNCPEPAGPDFDFGQAPSLFTVAAGPLKGRELLGAGQKSGQYWALDPSTGAVVWMTQTGPGGVAGGLQWGSAVDGRRIYTANANSVNVPWTLPSGASTTQGIWTGLDASTGRILWQTTPPNGGGASGPATTANGVVFGCSLDPQGHMYALDAADGRVLWQFASGGSCLSGAAISNGQVFWGSGYTLFGTSNNKVYAFGLG